MKPAGLACFIVGGCLLATPAIAQDRPTESPFFPLEVGNQWTYRLGDKKVVVRVAKHEVLEVNTGKGEKSKIPCALLQTASDDRSLAEHVVAKADGLYRLTSAGKEIVPPLCFLKLPPKKGESWVAEVNLDGTLLKGTFVVDEAEVTVPAGKYKCISSGSTEFLLGAGQKMELTYWFTPGIGLVKQHVRVGNFDLLLELEKFEKAKK